MKEVVFFSPAKINTTLSLSKEKENGLHDIQTEMSKVSLYDEVRLSFSQEYSSAPSRIHLSVENPFSFSLPRKSEDNLLVRAGKLFFSESLSAPTDMYITLIKNIPSGAGLGGGSGNAGVFLRVLSHLFPENTPEDFLKKMHTLGSDIPFFFSSEERALVTEYGKHIRPLPKKDFDFLLFVKPHALNISTKWAYAKWDKNPTFTNGGNDFEPLLFSLFPELLDIQKTLFLAGAKKVQLCGSGSTLYALFSSEREGKRARKIFPSEKYWIGVSQKKEKEGEEGEIY